MLYCRIHPTATECSACSNRAVILDRDIDCAHCVYNNRLYRVVGFANGLFKAYAFVELNGLVKRVGLDDIYDVREEN